MKTRGSVEGASRVKRRSNLKIIPLIAVIAVTILLILWVLKLGKKAEETVKVVMYNQTISKNEVVTEDKLTEYDMLLAEYEKYSFTQSSSGQTVRRVVLWDERSKIIGKYAVFTLKSNTVAESRDVTSSKIDNTDTVMYSYPGKNIVKLPVGGDDLSAFKTFLQPGDRINITVIYKEEQKITDEFGKETTVSTVKTDVLFQDIMLADMLNGSGDSILDIYESYNNKTTSQQQQLDASEAFQTSVTPSSLLIALTPEQEEAFYRYYYGTSNVEFKISLPQRDK